MQLSLIVRGQHPPGIDPGEAPSADDLDLVLRRRPARLRRRGQGLVFQRAPVPVGAAGAIPVSIARRFCPALRLICGLVLLPLHKPLDLAEQLATLDILSGGKLVFGCGIGFAMSSSRRSACRAQVGAPASRNARSGPPAVDRGLRHDERLAFRARPRQLHGEAVA